MSQLYQDSMAIAQEFGPASYFITVTVNPNWKEIQSALLPGQAANDCPDLVVHVFHKKLFLLLRHLKSILGHQVACVYAIEYWKCGLPHAHICNDWFPWRQESPQGPADLGSAIGLAPQSLGLLGGLRDGTGVS